MRLSCSVKLSLLPAGARPAALVSTSLLCFLSSSPSVFSCPFRSERPCLVALKWISPDYFPAQCCLPVLQFWGCWEEQWGLFSFATLQPFFQCQHFWDSMNLPEESRCSHHSPSLCHIVWFPNRLYMDFLKGVFQISQSYVNILNSVERSLSYSIKHLQWNGKVNEIYCCLICYPFCTEWAKYIFMGLTSPWEIKCFI